MPLSIRTILLRPPPLVYKLFTYLCIESTQPSDLEQQKYRKHQYRSRILTTNTSNMQSPGMPRSVTRSTVSESSNSNVQSYHENELRPTSTGQIIDDDDDPMLAKLTGTEQTCGDTTDFMLAKALLETHQKAMEDYRNEEMEAQRQEAATTLLEISHKPCVFSLQGLRHFPSRSAQCDDSEMTKTDSGADADSEMTDSDAQTEDKAVSDAEICGSDSDATGIIGGEFRRPNDIGNKHTSDVHSKNSDSDSDLTEILADLTPPTSPYDFGGQKVSPVSAARRGTSSASPSPPNSFSPRMRDWWTTDDGKHYLDGEEEDYQMEQVEWISRLAESGAYGRLKKQQEEEYEADLDEQDMKWALETPIEIPSGSEDGDYGSKKGKERQGKRKVSRKASTGKGKKTKVEEK